MAATPTNVTTTLRDETDYTRWLSQLQSLSATLQIWDKINPDSDKALLEKPALPQPPRVSTGYEHPAGSPTPTRVSDLTPKGQKAYKEDVDQYKLEQEYAKSLEREYKEEQAALLQVLKFIQGSVSLHLQGICCNPEEPLRQWIKNLRDTIGVDSDLELERARTRYYAALKPMRNPTNWQLWLLEYDEAVTNAVLHNVPEMQNKKVVFRDFTEAVSKVAGTFTSTFRQTSAKDLTMTRKDMIRLFREEMMTQYPPKGKHKAAFGAAASQPNRDSRNNSELEGDASRSERATQSRRGGNITTRKTRGGHTTRKRASDDASEGSLFERCAACQQPHNIKDCYYVHPGKAPEWFKPNAGIEELVKMKRAQNHPSLEGALRGQSRTRSQTRTQTPQIKSSHTPTPEVADEE